MAKTFISYRRVSTAKQGRSGLGLAAQQDIINYFVEREQGEIIADYVDVHSGKDLNDCQELQKAIRAAKKAKAVLVIAKSDRFRNVKQALEVLDEMGDGNLMCCDIPHTDRFTMILFWNLAERERLITSIRTKSALAQKKNLGSPIFTAKNEETEQERQERESKANDMRRRAGENAAKTHKSKADGNERNRTAYAAVKFMDGSLQEKADFLNDNGFVTPRGSSFTPMSIKRLLDRYSK